MDQDRLRFIAAVDRLEKRFAVDPAPLADANQDATLRAWLDGDDDSLPWAGCGVTADEWFFITTLYGEMTLDGQRSHIRTFFPRFVQEARRDIRAMTPELVDDWKLRSGWMKKRLCRMGAILREGGWTMQEYVDHLRTLEGKATPANPMPALDAIVHDHRASGWKTLSVFVRDCVGGNCFPIDSRVAKELERDDLPIDERRLVSLALERGRNPRQIARMFYAAGGD
ncbi:MAG TPA: hypothetical protein VFU81_13490 [Thermomicrobiales bacterium]|nr:hypothetical protein [Thermomicrobiales bacterium]